MNYIKKNILAIGPIPPPIHGQSLSFYETYHGLNCAKKYIINQNVTGKNILKTLIILGWAILKLIYILITKKIDLVYFTCSRSKKGALLDIIIINISKLFKAKLLNHIHGIDFAPFITSQTGYFRKILNYSYRKVEASIVLLPEIKKDIQPLFPKMQLFIVPNFYEKSLETTPPPKSSKNIRLLYLSNIIKSKGIMELLDSFEEISKNYQHVQLNIAGDFIGDEYLNAREIKTSFFKKLIILQKQGIKIKYIGIIKDFKKINQLFISDIFILPSYYKTEAAPLSIYEAMRTGNVIITTYHNLLPKIISPKNGTLITAKSIKDLTIALKYYLDHPQKMIKIQKFNQEYAKKHFSFDIYMKNIRTVMTKIA